MTSAEAFGQYLELYKAAYKAHDGILGRLNAACAAALPGAVESYNPEATDIRETRTAAMFSPDYGVNVGRIEMPADPAKSFRCGVPKLNSLLAVVTNDIFHPTDTMTRGAVAGLTYESLRTLSCEEAADAEKILMKSVDARHPDVLVNGMLLQDGIFIHSAAGTVVDKALQVVNIDAATVPMLSPRRIVIHAEADSQIKILLCDHSQSEGIEILNSQVVQIIAERGAKVELYDIEETNASTRRCCTVYADICDGATVVLNGSFLRGGVTRNEYVVNLNGQHAEAHLSGLGICTDSQILDNRVTLTHSGTDGHSSQLFKNALFDNAKASFGGKIIVMEGAERTDAVQTNRNLLASPDARMHTSPQLEIYCDDVKCGHGAATGQLDEQALFYMQTRGIPREEAVRMLTQAFMVDVVDNISFEVLRQRLHILVEKRLNGTSGSCDTCATACHPQSPEQL